VNEEQHRARRLAGLWLAEPLAIHPQGNIALLRPVFAAPDLGRRHAHDAVAALRGSRIRQRSRNKAKAGAFDDGAPRQQWIAIGHEFLPVTPGIIGPLHRRVSVANLGGGRKQDGASQPLHEFVNITAHGHNAPAASIGSSLCPRSDRKYPAPSGRNS